MEKLELIFIIIEAIFIIIELFINILELKQGKQIMQKLNDMEKIINEPMGK